MLSWILNNIEPNSVNSIAEYQTAKTLWDSLAVTDGAQVDSFEIYHLKNEVARQTQGNRSLEKYWNEKQRLWLAIDRRRPNPIKRD